MKKLAPSTADLVYAANMAVACVLSYWVSTDLLAGITDSASDTLGGMWAAVATVFVFKDSNDRSISAGASRLLATCVSFALCLAYLALFPFTAIGMAVLLALGTLIVIALDRRDEITTTGITTVVVMVVAGMSPDNAVFQPLLRLVDTVIGIGVGIGIDWLGLFLVRRFSRLATQ